MMNTRHQSLMNEISPHPVRCLLPLLLPLLLLSLWACSPEKEKDFIDDQPGLLNQQEREHLQHFNNALLQDMDIQFQLIILREKADDINTLATRLFGKLGEKTKGARGLLMVVDQVGNQVRIEVGYDLEGIFPDGFVGYLERAQMEPFFAAGKVGAGIEATTELMVARVQRAGEGYRFDPAVEIPDRRYFSGGGGASRNITISSAQPEKHSSELRSSFPPQPSPEAAFKMYMQVLRMHIKDPGLPLYTVETQTFFSRWVVTDAQQDNELRSLEDAQNGRYLLADNVAVLRHPASDRLHPPYFFSKGETGWMLDFATMSRVLQMNHQNMWMMKHMNHPYMFAFADWRFDKNGFPVAR